MSEPIRVLFVSTSNASRSILAEAILRRAGGPAYEAYSAGIAPTSAVADLALRILDDAGFEHDALRSKSISEYLDQPFDFVITVCDDARLVCPVFNGADQSLHWGYGDPEGLAGSEEERLAAYRVLFAQLGQRVRQFLLVTDRATASSAG
ncbi:MAG TPA: arsenate reductase ArsC [Verrucomicrobiae bacterium]|nr:arsenate reductase ArsC [Verrucomicrobiae bacterium]